MTTNQYIVFHDQDWFVTPNCHRSRCAPGDGRSLREGAWKVELDRGSSPQLGAEPDLTPRLIDEAVYHAEAQSRPPANLLGREEGLEDMGQHFGSDAATIVGHRDKDAVFPCGVSTGA